MSGNVFILDRRYRNASTTPTKAPCSPFLSVQDSKGEKIEFIILCSSRSLVVEVGAVEVSRYLPTTTRCKYLRSVRTLYRGNLRSLPLISNIFLLCYNSLTMLPMIYVYTTFFSYPSL
jgi:hypothetical protein